jgi:hypothetical protein
MGYAGAFADPDGHMWQVSRADGFLSRQGDGTTSVASSCDIYEFDKGVVAAITSYSAELDPTEHPTPTHSDPSLAPLTVPHPTHGQIRRRCAPGRERCPKHDEGICLAYFGEAQNNVGNSVGAEIYERTGLNSLEVTHVGLRV